MLTKVTTISDYINDDKTYVGVYLRNDDSYLEAQYLCRVDHILFLRKAISCRSRVKNIFELLSGCFEYGSNLNDSLGSELYYGLSDHVRSIVMNVYGKPSIVTAYDRHPQKLYLDWSKPKQKRINGLMPTEVISSLNSSGKRTYTDLLLKNARFSFKARILTCADSILLLKMPNSRIPPEVVFELLSGCFEHGSNFDREMQKILRTRILEKIDGIVMNLYGIPILVSRNNRQPESLSANWERQYKLAEAKICSYKI